jgi:hypothetical protein
MDKGVQIGFRSQRKCQQIVILVKRHWTRRDEPYLAVYREETVLEGIGPYPPRDHVRELTVAVWPR